MKLFIKKIFSNFSFTRKIYNKLSSIRSDYYLQKESKAFYRSLHSDKNSLFIIGSPLHTNIGDHAITIAQKNFLVQCGYNSKQIKEISLSEYTKYRKYLAKKISKQKAHIFLLGGGNMGNQWLCEENPRRTMICDFYNSKIVIFPQTIYYTPDEKGEVEKKKSIEFYNNKHELTIVAREKVSYDIMKDLYPNTNILFTPDIVLSADPKIFNISEYGREGVLFIMRMDKERSMDDDSRKRLMDEIKNLGLNYKVSDMHSDKPVTKENRDGIVSAKMNEFAAARLVITDRLHGMIFAAITGTPCIVFSNYNHKVKGTYDWISYLPYIKYVDTADKAKELIPEMLEMKNCKYDNSLLLPYFDKLKDVIKLNAEN